MSGKGKISILIMREDAGVRRLKVSPGFLRALIWLFVLFCAAAGLAGYASYYYWKESTARTAENALLRDETEASKDQLVKLASLEGILKGGDQTELKTLLGSYNADAAERLECQPPEPETPPAPVAPGSEAPKETPECPKVDLRGIFDKVDLTLAGVDNFKATLDNKHVRIAFDLSNVSPQTALSGDAECQLLTNAGDLIPLKTKREDLNFQIQRFKQVSASGALPPKVEPADVYGVKMIIKDPDGKIIFSNVYPLSKS